MVQDSWGDVTMTLRNVCSLPRRGFNHRTTPKKVFILYKVYVLYVEMAVHGVWVDSKLGFFLKKLDSTKPGRVFVKLMDCGFFFVKLASTKCRKIILHKFREGFCKIDGPRGFLCKIGVHKVRLNFFCKVELRKVRNFFRKIDGVRGVFVK